MASNTGNAPGSTHPKDLIDNAEDFDFLLTGTGVSHPNRLGVPLKSWKGMEGEFDAVQAQRVIDFNQLLKNSAYEVPVDYVASLVITRPTQTVRFSGELYRGKDASLPFTTTTWAADSAKFFAIGDAALRQELSSALAVPITKHGAVADWNGTTGTNNKAAVLAAWNEVIAGNYATMYIPHGRFHIALTDADVTDLGFNRDFAFLIATGKKGIMVTGPGELHITCSASSKRVLLGAFKDCDDCHVFGFRLTGDLVKQDAVPNSETGVASGFMFYHCTGSGISHSTLRKLIIPAWFTGQPVSPATVTDVSACCYLTENRIIDFEQNSTFGAGAFGLKVQGNRFINGYTAFKVSQNPSGDAAAGKAGLIDFSGNTVYWTEDAKFAAVFFSPSNSMAAVGLMIECSNTEVVASGNTISLEGMTIPSLPPYGNAGPIVIFESLATGTAGALIARRVKVEGGSLIAKAGYSNRFAIDSTSNVYDLTIQGVHHTGGFRVQTTALTSIVYGDLCIKGNVGKGLPGFTQSITVGLGRWRKVQIEQNTQTGIAGQETSGAETIMFLSGFVCEDLIINGNNLGKGTIGNFGFDPVTCTNLVSKGCTLRSFDLATIGTLRAALNNDCITTGTATKLVLDAATMANCRVSVGGSCSGPTGINCTTALNLNGGLLRLNSTEMFAVSGSAFLLAAAVIVHGGDLYGSGAPAYSALMGVRYSDFNAGADGNYDKTTSSGTGGWKKRMYV